MSIRSRAGSAGPTAARGMRLFAGLSATAMLLSGCSGAEAGAASEASESSWQAAAFAPIYAQEIEWFACTEADGLDGETAEELEAMGFELSQVGCAEVSAPLDWDDPDNDETIDVAIVHLPATGGEPQGTLLGNPGGPGATGVDFMMGMALSPGFEEVAEHYDLLGFDPRGIGGSSPIDCDGAGSELPVVQLGTCIADNVLAHTMGTSQVARDMELLRHLMGDEVLNYLGYSYGTMLGATYATIFPEQVGRLVLDSAENAEWASPIHLFDQSVAISNATLALATSCRTEYQDEVEVCPFVDEDTLLAVLDRLNSEPLVGSDGTQVSGERLQEYLSGALYQSHFERGRTLDTIAFALFGNQDAIDEIAAEFADGDGVDMAFTIVTCHSFPIEPDIPALLAHITEVGMPRLMGGPEINDATLEPYLDLSCYGLPESGLDLTDSFSAKDANPILVIGVTGDHATPFQYASALTDELGNAVLLTLDGQGHVASYEDRSVCVDDTVTRYLLSGELPEEGTVCQDD